MSNNASTVTPTQSMIKAAADAADAITLATSIMRDLLRLAIEDASGADNCVASAIRAAERYIEDIEQVAECLHDNAMQIGGAV